MGRCKMKFIIENFMFMKCTATMKGREKIVTTGGYAYVSIAALVGD
jgi:hypothetical protein